MTLTERHDRLNASRRDSVPGDLFEAVLRIPLRWHTRLHQRSSCRVLEHRPPLTSPLALGTPNSSMISIRQFASSDSDIIGRKLSKVQVQGGFQVNILVEMKVHIYIDISSS